MSPEPLHPAGWAPARGYSHGMTARGRLVVTGGLIGWTGQGAWETDDFVEQCAQALRNVRDVLAAGGAEPRHLVRLTWYVTSIEDYLASLRPLGLAYRAALGAHYPAMALVQVVRLVEPRAQVEIEATAVVPEEP